MSSVCARPSIASARLAPLAEARKCASASAYLLSSYACLPAFSRSTPGATFAGFAPADGAAAGRADAGVHADREMRIATGRTGTRIEGELSALRVRARAHLAQRRVAPLRFPRALRFP